MEVKFKEWFVETQTTGLEVMKKIEHFTGA
jgi:hypothetical protein